MKDTTRGIIIIVIFLILVIGLMMGFYYSIDEAETKARIACRNYTESLPHGLWYKKGFKECIAREIERFK